MDLVLRKGWPARTFKNYVQVLFNPGGFFFHFFKVAREIKIVLPVHIIIRPPDSHNSLHFMFFGFDAFFEFAKPEEGRFVFANDVHFGPGWYPLLYSKTPIAGVDE